MAAGSDDWIDQPRESGLTPNLFMLPDFPGWDVYMLQAGFDTWVAEAPGRAPKDYEAAFYGFVRQHHARNSG